MNDLGCKRLAAAVLRKAVLDVRSENTDLSERAKIEIEAGGCDLFLALLGIEMSGREFTKKAFTTKP